MATKRICSVEHCDNTVHSFGMCRNHHRRNVRYGTPLGGVFKGEARVFLAAALESETDSCIEWPYGTAGRGYGVITVDGCNKYVHRLVCEKTHGPAPKDLQAAHSCGNSGCINKRHLRWATRIENMADQLLHGTRNKGSRHGNAKFTESHVSEILALIDAGTKQVEIANLYGVSRMAISQINTGRCWSHVKRIS